MPRQSRIDAPGALHHIINRGIEKNKIFRDKIDYQNFLGRFSKLIESTGTTCYAWSLMPNHFHLLLQTGQVPLSKFMMRLLGGHATTYNRRHGRSGHVFQDRYKSILCQKDSYLKVLVRYIHLNPLRAKIVSSIDELNTYPYTGHSVIKGHLNHDWQDTDYILSQFANTPSLARRRYGLFIKEGQDQGRRTELTGGGLIRSYNGWKSVKELRKSDVFLRSDERILGDSDFVSNVLKQAQEQETNHTSLKQKRLTEIDVRKRVSEIIGIKPEKLLSHRKDRLVVRAKRLYCYWLAKNLGYSMTDIARIIETSVSTVSRSVKAGEMLCDENGWKMEKDTE